MRKMILTLIVSLAAVNLFIGCATQQIKSGGGLNVEAAEEVNWGSATVIDLSDPEGLSALLALELNDRIETTESKSFTHQTGSGEFSFITMEFSNGYVVYRQEGSKFGYIALSGRMVDVTMYNGEEYAITWTSISGSIFGGYFEVYNLTTAEKLTAGEIYSGSGWPKFFFHEEGPLFVKAHTMIPMEYTTFYNLDGSEIGGYSGWYYFIGPYMVQSKESDFEMRFDRIITVDLRTGEKVLEIQDFPDIHNVNSGI